MDAREMVLANYHLGPGYWLSAAGYCTNQLGNHPRLFVAARPHTAPHLDSDG